MCLGGLPLFVPIRVVSVLSLFAPFCSHPFWGGKIPLKIRWRRWRGTVIHESSNAELVRLKV
jgi:hypothetical protein